jgi:hypothetical protein
MIAKRIPARTNGRGFGGLARYIVDANGQARADTWTRTADYILDTAHDGAKVSGVRVTNCGTDDAALATAAVLVTQARYESRPGRKSAASRSYHLVISFPPGERPGADVLRAVEDRLVESIGYGEHQRISAVHNDTDHLHIHVAINKVHPRTLRNVEPYYDKARLMETCAALELRYGLTRTNHGKLDASSRMNAGAEALEAHTGHESLTRWVRENARTALLDALMAGDWQAIHAAAARYGLTVKPHGAGMAIVDDASGIGIKASAVDRALSSKALLARLGTFQPKAGQTATARDRYHATPARKHPGTSALWTTFQRQRDEALAARGTTRHTHADEHAVYVTELRRWYREKAAHLKVRTDLNRIEKRAAWKALFAERAADFARERERYAAQRRQASSAMPVPTWPGFLAKAAANGDSAAAFALQSRQRKAAATGKEVPASNATMRTPTPATNHNGTDSGKRTALPTVPHKPRRGR